MQHKILSLLLAGAVMSTGLGAQEATPPTAAPSAQATAPTSAPAPTLVPSQVAPSQAAPAPSQVIYSPRLPTPAELTSVATAQGLTVEQISQSPNQVTAIYRGANGDRTTIAYQLLPTSAPAPTTVVAPTPPPTVVYEQAPTVVYYRDRYYDPFWPRYSPPVSLSFGFGYSNWSGHAHHHRGRW